MCSDPITIVSSTVNNTFGVPKDEPNPVNTALDLCWFLVETIHVVAVLTREQLPVPGCQLTLGFER